ncbi:branched-chain amino acid ABC transporter permease [Marinobacter flavimaris]|jgi:branched-chain amino acid transport system permease protein|uniref:Branched-chain amino acid ABC transporter permease n=2 Tax=Marinobacter TaxID=2742 RepID=A0A3D8H556_9GAMM|nr:MULTISPECIES: branched-chain amino acid ABC transporter permease [Marinobacter]MTI76423.1 branched-chain amino acid ABC transporter permease [Marinobacter sp.]HAS77165.1 branched-chain amino acid ABC transporter permease [Marinobacter adhaerens]EHJ02903.1 branched-chain amino acid ABC transporter, permease protein [Marinobacter manganoxydans MnI7-9]PPI81390.1 branched-chain amino acid ABC transporter permease [Marinobacter flavimaris]RDU41842.1 branched-chain amino acid ABC transporter perm|tara:strand:- start:713 stop:1600 length:888 start_codon:yes stop_codon:yes gene_type:complete
MSMIFGVPLAVLSGQLLIGIINGAFYALLSLGLAVIFGLLKIINFAHGAMYMLGALTTVLMFDYLGVNYWVALLLAPLLVGAFGVAIEYFLLRRIAGQDHIYSLLLTFGVALIISGVLVNWFGVSGLRYTMPDMFKGGVNLGFMFMPYYRAWVIVAALVVCFATWFVIEKTKLGAYLRAGTEDSQLMQGFGINVPLLISLTYGFGVALAAFAGVLAAPIYSVTPVMGSATLITVFAVVVIGGMGSIGGAIITGILMGVIEGLTKTFYPPASSAIIFLVMVLVLMFRPSGLFGKEA